MPPSVKHILPEHRSPACSPPPPDQLVVTADRTGQYAIVMPPGARRTYATSGHLLCTSCAEAGIVKRGEPRAPGRWSMPLCLSCYIGREQRRARKERRAAPRVPWDIDWRDYEEAWEQAAEVAEALRCPACDAQPDAPSGGLDTFKLPNQRHQEQARRRVQARAAEGCWRCGHSWLEWARRAFTDEEAQRAAEGAAEAALRAKAEAERFEQIAAVAENEKRVEQLTRLVRRYEAMLDGHERGSGLARPVELLADLAARYAPTRTSARGRPCLVLEVGAVLAQDSNYRSGRGGMPGRAETAEIVDCILGTVSSCWKLLQELRWAVLVEAGRLCTEAERRATGRSRNRAKFDLVPLHRSHITPEERAKYIPDALRIYRKQLERITELLAVAESELDAARAAAAGTTSWQQKADRRALRAQVDRALSTADRAITRATTANTTSSTARARANKRTPPGGTDVSVYSCSPQWGLQFARPTTIHTCTGGCRPLRGRKATGASRSPARSQARRRRPDWAVWANPMARELLSRWRWLRPVPVFQLAAVLGRALGPEWTADRLVAYVERECRDGWELLEAPQHPVAYLRKILRAAFTLRNTPPWSARIHRELCDQVVVAERNARLARQNAATAHERADRAANPPVPLAASGAAAAITDWRAQAKRRAEQRRAEGAHTHAERTEPALDTLTWPEVRQPGSGLPSQRQSGPDRTKAGGAP